MSALSVARPMDMEQENIFRIIESSKKNTDHLSELLVLFSPLLKKYARLLPYVDSYSDLQEVFIRLVLKMDTKSVKNRSDSAMVSYIQRPCIISILLCRKSRENIYKPIFC